MSTVLHAWSQIPGLIPENEIIQVLKDKCCCLKGKELENKEGNVSVVDSDMVENSDDD